MMLNLYKTNQEYTSSVGSLVPLTGVVVPEEHAPGRSDSVAPLHSLSALQQVIKFIVIESKDNAKHASNPLHDIVLFPMLEDPYEQADSALQDPKINPASLS
jgi:hypothetical protein